MDNVEIHFSVTIFLKILSHLLLFGKLGLNSSEAALNFE